MRIEDLASLKGQTFAIDTETTGLHWWRDAVIGISIHCPALNISAYLPTCDYVEVRVPAGRAKKAWHGDYEPTLTRTGKPSKRKKYVLEQAFRVETRAIPNHSLIEAARAFLLSVANDPKTCMIFHNSRFDCHMLNLDLLGKPCLVLDTSVMVHLYDSRLHKSLADAERVFLGTKSKRSHVLKAPKGLSKKMYLWPLDVLTDYAVNDAIVTYQLAETLLPKLRGLQLTDLLRSDMEYSKVLWQIERRGVMLNPLFCHSAMEAFANNLTLMEQELQETVGYDFNWRSNPQLSKALYDDLNIAKPKNPFEDEDGVDRSRFAFKGKYNKYCTSSFLLMEKANHPLGGLILDMREAAKLRKTVDKYLELMDDQQVLHTNYNLTGTRTGRLSSSNPNVQNVASQHRVRETQSAYSGGAIRQEEYNLRQAFVARPGYTYVSIDHAQQEQRLFAILAQEPIMMEALRQRKDIHLMIALAVWGDCGPERNKLHRELPSSAHEMIVN